jgi:hypothetical protein
MSLFQAKNQEISAYYNPESLLAVKNSQATSLCNLFDPFQSKSSAASQNRFDVARYYNSFKEVHFL